PGTARADPQLRARVGRRDDGRDSVGRLRPDFLRAPHDDRPALAALADPPPESAHSLVASEPSIAAVPDDRPADARHQDARLRLRCSDDACGGDALMATTLEVPRPPLAPDEFSRADLEFRGVDHSGPSFEARVYLNNADAGAETPLTEDTGYAGSFWV